MKRIIAVLAFLYCAQFTEAKELNVAIFYNQYLSVNGQPYIETYFSLDPSSVILTKNENKSWQGGIFILITIEREGEIVAYDKLQLKSTETLDSSQILPQTIQQSRLKLEPGNYIMKIEIADQQKPEEPVTLEQAIAVDVTRDEINSSSILILDSYQESPEGSVVSKYGYDLVPIVPIGTYYIPDAMENLPFYCEIFNADTVFGKNQPFMIKYYIYDNLNNNVLSRYAGFKRVNSAVVNPVLNTFNIKNLPTGYYNLVLEVVNKNNEIVRSENASFYRRNINADYQEYDLTQISLTETFVESITNPDSLYYYIDCLYPISTDGERRIEKNLLLERDTAQMQRFFLSFWNKRNPLDPRQSWEAYMVKVNYTNKEFGSTSVKGYRTDMGRVLLQYGEPTTIERSDHDPSNYPWRIWQYDQLLSAATPLQTNQMFVFVDQTLAGRNYYLIHSTGIGEVKDHKWEYALNRNTNRGYDVDATSTQQGRDNFGYRVNNNFIIGDHRYWGDR